MRYNKEQIYHFTCERCNMWWSVATEEMSMSNKTWHCPWCGHKHKPPHIDRNATVIATEEQLQKLRELI